MRSGPQTWSGLKVQQVQHSWLSGLRQDDWKTNRACQVKCWLYVSLIIKCTLPIWLAVQMVCCPLSQGSKHVLGAAQPS